MTASWSAPKATAPICSGPSRRPTPARRNDKSNSWTETDMPYATTDDGVHLYFEETGSGRPLILVHEFAGDLRSYEQQMRHFGKRYRAIAFNARGFPLSDVPEHVSSYSQARPADDILAALDHFVQPQSHVIGVAIRGFAPLNSVLRLLKRARAMR